MGAELPAAFEDPEGNGPSRPPLGEQKEDEEAAGNEGGVRPGQVAETGTSLRNWSGFNQRCPYCDVWYGSLTTDPSLRDFAKAPVSGARASVLHKWTNLVAKHVSHCKRAPRIRRYGLSKERDRGSQQAPPMATRRSTRTGKKGASNDMTMSLTTATRDESGAKRMANSRPDGGTQSGGMDPKPARPKRKLSQTSSAVGAARPMKRKQDAGTLHKAALLNATRALQVARRPAIEGEYDDGEGIIVNQTTQATTAIPTTPAATTPTTSTTEETPTMRPAKKAKKPRKK